MTATLIEHLANFAANVRFDDLPADVVSEAKRLILDCAACGMTGYVGEKGKTAVEVGRQMGSDQQATILGLGPRVSVQGAAFANGELINAMEYDALLTPPGHATPYVAPALLALAEKSRVPGKQLLMAVAVSHEACLRLGRAMGYYRDPARPQTTMQPVTGFSSTVLGATLGAAKLLSLSPAQAANAVGLAGRMAPAQSSTKWLRTSPLSMDKSLMAGWAAQVPITAVMLASKGYTGDTSLLEGEFGFYRFMGSTKWNPGAMLDGLGERWDFPRSTIYKYYPGCRVTHTALDCFCSILVEEGLQPEEIESIHAYIDAHVAGEPAWAATDIRSHIDAQMSVPYTFAVAAHRVPIGMAWFAADTLRSEKILGFMPKVKFEGHPDYFKALEKDPASRIGGVEVTARGKKYAAQRNYRKGSPATPETRMTDQELEDKFRRCASGLLPARKIENACRQIWTLQQLDDVSVLMQDLAL
ncbi:MAG: MmgE/PrpD family protein [Chloroflexi bacterium]|nr:MmgE/PrpD family protein [Chloroflexota bacterium]